MSLQEASEWRQPRAELLETALLDEEERQFLLHLVLLCKKRLVDEEEFEIDPSDPAGNILAIMKTISVFEYELAQLHKKSFIAPHHAQHLRKLIVAQSESIRRTGRDIPNPFYQNLRSAYRPQYEEYSRFTPDGSDLSDAWRAAVDDVSWLEGRLERPQE